MFLDISVELRLLIYEFCLDDIRLIVNGSQPSNGHLSLLQTCRQISFEADAILRTYVSLRNELQIQDFLHQNEHHVSQVRWADVACDGRVINRVPETAFLDTPVSQLHAVLCRMSSLQTLRVFESHRGFPIRKSPYGARIRSDMEQSMFPTRSPIDLLTYELHIKAETKITPFIAINSTSLQRLRLTGDCHLPQANPTSESISNLSFPSLQHLAIVSVTGNYFDQHSFAYYFPTASNLRTFIYKHGHKLGFEIRDHHLVSLAEHIGSRMRKLVLLGCTRPASATIAHCLRNLPCLEYFALSLITVSELRENFVLAIPPSVAILKLAVTQAWYAIPLIDEERRLCEALEERMMCRTTPLEMVCVDFRNRLLEEKRYRWMEIAVKARFTLIMGNWEMNEDV